MRDIQLDCTLRLRHGTLENQGRKRGQEVGLHPSWTAPFD